MKNAAVERYTWCLYWLCEKKCPLSLTEKHRQIRYIGNMMEIKKFKSGFDCTGYSGVKRIAKLLVKFNLEMVMILMGTLYFKISGKSENLLNI